VKLEALKGKRAILLLSALGILLFLAGLTIGIGILSKTAGTAAQADAQLPALPKGLPKDVAKAAKDSPVKPPDPKLDKQAKSAGAGVLKTQTPGKEGTPDDAEKAVPETKAAAPKPPGKGEAAAQAKSEQPPPPEEFCIQLGTFNDPKIAKALQASLKEKGYNPIIFQAVDADHKTWHAVRIGGYKDLESASHAAAEFSS
jgi:cell division septation protein DedD